MSQRRPERKTAVATASELVVLDDASVTTARGTILARHTDGDNPPLVLMHGFPDDHRIYQRLLPRLAPRRCVIFDWLGYGRSDRPEAPAVTAADHAAEIDAVLDHLAIDKAVLVGHDASGPDAIEYALRHPGRTAQVVLLNTYFGRRPSFRLPEMIRLFAEPELKPLADAMTADENQRMWLLQHTGSRFGLEPLVPGGLGVTTVLPQFFGSEDQPDALRAIRAWTAGLPSALDHQDELIASGRLERLDIPVTIIFGRDDQYLNPALASELGELFANANVNLIDGASHWPQHDRPDEVAALILSDRGAR